MRWVVVKPLVFRPISSVFFRRRDTPPLSRRSEPFTSKGLAEAACARRFQLSKTHLVRPRTTIAITRARVELAASTSQGPCGSSAPSIRGGAMHRTPETPFRKPGSESPFSPSVPRGHPVYSPATRTSLCDDPCAITTYADAQAAWLLTIAPSGISPRSTYRHNAISNFRASATMPMRRSRLLPPPNRR